MALPHLWFPNHLPPRRPERNHFPEKKRKPIDGNKSSATETPYSKSTFHVAATIGEKGAVATQFASLIIVGTSAAPAPVRKSWLDAHCVWPKSLKIGIPKKSPEEVTFRFGDGNTLPALGQSLIPICFQGKWVYLDASMLEAPRPARLSVNSLRGNGFGGGLETQTPGLS